MGEHEVMEVPAGMSADDMLRMAAERAGALETPSERMAVPEGPQPVPWTVRVGKANEQVVVFEVIIPITGQVLTLFSDVSFARQVARNIEQVVSGLDLPPAPSLIVP